MPVSAATRIFRKSFIESFAIASRFPDSTVLNGSTFASSGFAFMTAGTRSRQKTTWHGTVFCAWSCNSGLCEAWSCFVSCRAGDPFFRNPICGPPALEVLCLPWLVALVLIDLFLDFPLHRLQIERSGRLHWWKLDGRLCQFRYLLLHEHETPKLTRKERVKISTA